MSKKNSLQKDHSVDLLIFKLKRQQKTIEMHNFALVDDSDSYIPLDKK